MLRKADPSTQQRDLALLRAVRNGGPEASAAEQELVVLYQGAIKAVVRSLCPPANLYEDCLQVARIGLLTAMRRFRPGFGARLWSYAVHYVRGEVVRLLRREHEHRKAVQTLGHTKAAARAQRGSEMAAAVRVFVLALPERHRKLVQQVYWAGMSQAEVARDMGVSRTMVTKLMRSVRRKAKVNLCFLAPLPAAA